MLASHEHDTHWIFDFHSNSTTAQYGISYLILTSLSIIYFSIMCVLTISTLWCTKNKVNNPIRIISTIHTISYILSYLLIGTMFFLPSYSIINWYTFFYIIHSIFFSLGHLSFYIFLLLQVYYAFVDNNFHGSIYTVSVAMMYGHCVLFVIDIILFICIWYFWYTTWYTNKYILVFVVLSVVAGILLLFSIFHFIYTFNSKLLLFTINLGSSATNLNHRQIELINVMTKQSVLWCYSLFVIISLIIIAIFLFVFKKLLIFDLNTETMSCILRWFVLIERITEQSAIYLSFIMNDKIYIKLCQKCHFLLQDHCHKLAEKKITQQSKKKDANLPPIKNPNLKTNIKSNSSVEILGIDDKEAKEKENDESFLSITDDDEQNDDIIGPIPVPVRDINITATNTGQCGINVGQMHGGQISGSTTYLSATATVTVTVTDTNTNSHTLFPSAQCI